MAYTKSQWERWKREHPKEWKKRAEKIAKSHRGKRLSQKHKAAIAKAMSGRKLSLQQRKKISESVKKVRSARPSKLYHAMRRISFGRMHFERKHALYVAGIFALALIITFGLTNLGLFAQADWTKYWENRKDLTVDNSVEYVTTHVAFGLYRPEKCGDGILVATGEQNVSFEVLNPILDENGRCSEADVRFRNVIYAPAGFEIRFVEPTPPDGAVLNESGFAVKVSTTESTNLTLIEWGNETDKNTDVMSGFDMEWSYNLTNLTDGAYKYRALATNVTGETTATDYRSVTISIGAPPWNATAPAENVTAPAENTTEKRPKNDTVPRKKIMEEPAAHIQNATPFEPLQENITAPTENETVPSPPNENTTIQSENVTQNATVPTGAALEPPSATYYVYYGKKTAKELTTVTFAEPTPASGTVLPQNYAFINVTTDTDADTVLLEITGPNGTTAVPMLGEGQVWGLNLTDLTDGSYFLKAFANDTGKMVASETREIIVGEAKDYEVDVRQGAAVTGKPVQWKGYIKIKNTHAVPRVVKINFDKNTLPDDASNVTIKEKVSGLKRTAEELKKGVEVLPGTEETLDVGYETPPPEEIESKPVQVNDVWTKLITITSNASVDYANITASVGVIEVLPQQLRLYWLVNGNRINVTDDPAFDVKKLDKNGNGLTDELQWTVPHLSNQTFEVEADLTILNVQSYPVVGGNWTVMFTTVGQADLWIRAVDGTTWSNSNENNDLKFIEVKCGETILGYTWVGENNSVLVPNYACNETGYETSKVLTQGAHTLEFSFGSSIEYAYNLAQGTPALNSTSAYNLTSDNITCYNQSSVGVKTNIYTWYNNSKALARIYLPFDSSSTVSANLTNDYAGIGNPPAHLGNYTPAFAVPTWTANGRVGGAFYFDRNKRSCILGPNNTVLGDNVSSITVEGWFNSSTADSTKRGLVFALGGYILYINFVGSGDLCPAFDGSSAGNPSTTLTNYANGQWHYFVAMNNGTHTSLYVDGVKNSQIGDYAETLYNNALLNRYSIIGAGGLYCNVDWFNGTIDEIAAYPNVTFTAAQVQQRYTDMKNGFTSNRTIVNNELTNGDQWTCQITPSDGAYDGVPLNSSTLAVYSTYQTAPILTSTSGFNRVTDNFTCYNQSSMGVKTNIYNFYKNGVSTTALNLPFDSGNSAGAGKTKDYSGYQRNGTNRNTTLTSSGKIGAAYTFNGVNSSISLDAYNASLNLSTGSLELWFKSNASLATGGQQIFGWGDGTGNNLGGLGAGSWTGDYADESLGYYIATSATDRWMAFVRHGQGYYADNNWHHVVVVVNSTNNAIYVDGVKETLTYRRGSESVGNYFLNTANYSLQYNHMAVGKRFLTGSDLWWNGTVDNVIIWKTPLSDAEAYQRYLDTKDGHSDSQTLVSQETAVGDNLICEVTPNDGTYDGTLLNSSGVAVIGDLYDAKPSLNVTGGTYLMDYIISSGGNFSGSPYKVFLTLGCTINSSRQTGTGYEAQLGCMFPLGIDDVTVTYVSPTPANNSISHVSTVTINATVVSSSTDQCVLQWNGANESMTKATSGTTTYCYKAKSMSVGSTNTFQVFANNTRNIWGSEGLRIVNYTGLKVISVNITPSSPTTADSLTCHFNISNITSATLRVNVTWYNDTVHITDADENFITCQDVSWCSGTKMLLAGNYTSKSGHLTCQVTAYNDLGDSDLLNGTVLVGNSCPQWDPVPTDQYAAVGSPFSYKLNATDVDSDALTFGRNDTSYSINASTGLLNKTFTSSGSDKLFVNATDGTCTITATFTVSTRGSTGAACNQDSDCASGYCRHDYDWIGAKKVCAGPTYWGYYGAISEFSCVRTYANGTNLSVQESGPNTYPSNGYGFLPNISLSIYPEDTMKPLNETYPGKDPAYFCYDGRWSEDPMVTPMEMYTAEHSYGIATSKSVNGLHSRTYNDLYFYDNASSDTSTVLMVNKSATWSKVTMEISGYNVTDWMPNVAVVPPAGYNATYANTTYYDIGMAYCDGRYYAVMARITYSQWFLMVKTSDDGGRTWPNETYVDIRPSSYPRGPAIACSGDNVYVVWSNLSSSGPHYYSGKVMFAKSSDAGNTWSTPINITPFYYDAGADRKKELDVYGNYLNVLFMGAPTVDGGLSWPSIIRSTDAGTTWQTVNTTANYPTTTWLYPHMERYNSTTLVATGFAPYNGTQIMFSYDNGATWGPLRTIFSGSYMGEYMLPYFKITNVSGTMTYSMAFGDWGNPSGIPYFNFSTSTDGIIWTTPVKLEGYPPVPTYPLRYAGWPRLARVDNVTVVILENINVGGCGYKCTYDTSYFYYMYSKDGGVTWSDIKPIGNPIYYNYIVTGALPWVDQPTILMPTTNSSWSILWHFGNGPPDNIFGDVLFSRYGTEMDFPSNITVSLGGTTIFTRAATLTETLSPQNITDFSSTLNSMAACTCTGCITNLTTCEIPVKVTSNIGKIVLDDLTGTGNTPPYWDPQPANQTVQVNTVFRYDANATDSDGDTLTYGINDTSFTINTSTGVINKTYGSTGVYPVTVNVTDGHATITASFFITVLSSSGSACTQNSDCYSGYCRHDWDWNMSKKFCAIDSTSCVHDNVTAVYANISSMGPFPNEYTTPASQTFSGEPYRRCYNGHWSEEPYRTVNSTFHDVTFMSAGSNMSGYINVPMWAGMRDAVMEVSGYQSDAWVGPYNVSDGPLNTSYEYQWSSLAKAGNTLFAVFEDNRNNTDQWPTVTNWSVYFAKSTDGGVTWSTNIKLNQGLPSDPGSQYNSYQLSPTIYAVNSTMLYAAWWMNGNGTGTYRGEWLVNSTDGGNTWNAPLNITPSTFWYDIMNTHLCYFNNTPIVVMNTWNNDRVYVTNKTASGWGEPILLADSTGQYQQTSCTATSRYLYVTAKNNSGAVQWILYNSSDLQTYTTSTLPQSTLPNTIFAATIANKSDTLYVVLGNYTFDFSTGNYWHSFWLMNSTDNGVTWSALREVDRSNTDHAWGDDLKYYPELFIDGSNFGICYTQYYDNTQVSQFWGVYLSTDGGNIWTDRKAITDQAHQNYFSGPGFSYPAFYHTSYWNGPTCLFYGNDTIFSGVTDFGINPFVVSGYVSSVIKYISPSYPLNPKVDVGNDGADWSYSGTFDEIASPLNVTFTNDLRGILRACTCSGCSILGGTNCSVPINLTTSSAGKLTVDNMMLYYQNVSPTLGNVLVEDDIAYPYNQIDLAGGGTKQVICNGTVNDANGAYDFNGSTPTGRFYYPEGVLNLTNASGIWHFDEGSGQTTADSSGNGNTASLGNTSASEVNDPVWTASGRFGNALVFDGNDDSVNASNASSLNIVGSLTVEAWVKTASTDNSQGILDKTGAGDATNKGYLVWIGTGRPRFRIVQGGALTSIVGTTNISNNPGTWYHVAATYGSNSGMRLYVNGVLEDSNTTVNGPIDSTTGDLLIGAIGNGASGYNFNGTMDEVAVYNYNKSAGEIAADASPSTCAADNNWCYVNSTCSWLGLANETAQNLECRFPVWYNAYNTSNQTWICNLTVADSGGLQAAGNDTTDVNPLLAVGTPALIAFGSMAVGSTSATDVNASIQNYGNTRIDLSLNGSSLTCSVGSVAASYEHYHCSAYGQAYGSMTALSGTLTSASCTGFDLAKNSTYTTQAPIASTKDLPWKINVPSAVLGSCQGTIWFAAVAG